MRKQIVTIILLIVMTMGVSYGQTPDSLNKNRMVYLQQLLKTDTLTARKVSVIQNIYKQAVKQVMENTRISEPEKRLAIDSLIVVKNRRLEQLLPVIKRSLLIPTTERNRSWNSDTSAKTNR